MLLEDLIKLCESKQKSLEDYESIKQLIEKEYDKLSETDQYILGEHLDFWSLRLIC